MIHSPTTALLLLLLTGRWRAGTKHACVLIRLQLILFVTGTTIRAERVDTVVIANEPLSTFVDVFAHASRFVQSVARLADAPLVKEPAAVLVLFRTGVVR